MLDRYRVLHLLVPGRHRQVEDLIRAADPADRLEVGGTHQLVDRWDQEGQQRPQPQQRGKHEAIDDGLVYPQSQGADVGRLLAAFAAKHLHVVGVRDPPVLEEIGLGEQLWERRQGRFVRHGRALLLEVEGIDAAKAHARDHAQRAQSHARGEEQVGAFPGIVERAVRREQAQADDVGGDDPVAQAAAVGAGGDEPGDTLLRDRAQRVQGQALIVQKLVQLAHPHAALHGDDALVFVDRQQLAHAIQAHLDLVAAGVVRPGVTGAHHPDALLAARRSDYDLGELLLAVGNVALLGRATVGVGPVGESMGRQSGLLKPRRRWPSGRPRAWPRPAPGYRRVPCCLRSSRPRRRAWR